MPAFSPLSASGTSLLFVPSTASVFRSTNEYTTVCNSLRPPNASLRLARTSSFLPQFARAAPPTYRTHHIRTTATSTAASNTTPALLEKEQTLNPTAADSISSTPDTPVTTISFDVAKSALGSLIQYFGELGAREPYIIRRFIAAVLCIILSKLIGITVPFFFKQAVDELMLHASAKSQTRSLYLATTAVILHGIARIAASITHELRNSIFAKSGQRIGRSITAASFAHLHSLEIAFHNECRTGALTRVVDRGTRSIMVIFRAILFSFFPSFFELFLVSAVLFTRFSYTYVIITLLTFFAFAAWTLWINDIMSAVRTDMNAADNDASAKLTDSLINIEAVKVFDNARLETNRYDLSLERYETVAIRGEWLFAGLNMGQTCAYTVGLTALLLLTTYDIAIGKLTVGSLVLLTTMIQRLWVPLNFLGWQYREVKQSLIDMQNLFDILQRVPTIVDVPNAATLAVSRGDIAFEDVTFVYPAGSNTLSFTQKTPPRISTKTDMRPEGNGMDGSAESDTSLGGAEDGIPQHGGGGQTTAVKTARRQKAINNLSFTVPAGSSVALVGASGSGKSTATRLVCRLYDVTSGRILIDGQDVSNVSLSSLRKAVSIVPQDTALFNDTIAYNIRYGRPTASDEEVQQAAKAALIHDVIMRTEHGYDTMVGERGVRLSGGERQRLSVARAFLKGSHIIVEDESTSALDSLTEMEVSKALRELGVNRTRIIVAHRLSTIMNVDQIIVLKDGQKAEQGSFDDLVQKPDGLFRDMWLRQQRTEAGDDLAVDNSIS